MSTATQTILYTAHAHVRGGRGGAGRTSDGGLDVALAPPGSGRPGTNPEQLFGIGYSSCFLEAIHLNATARKLRLPEQSSVDAEVSLLKTEANEYQLAVLLKVDLPGIEESMKQELVKAAHQTCPYSRMTRGHVEVELAIV